MKLLITFAVSCLAIALAADVGSNQQPNAVPDASHSPHCESNKPNDYAADGYNADNYSADENTVDGYSTDDCKEDRLLSLNLLDAIKLRIGSNNRDRKGRKRRILDLHLLSQEPSTEA